MFNALRQNWPMFFFGWPPKGDFTSDNQLPLKEKKKKKKKKMFVLLSTVQRDRLEITEKGKGPLWGGGFYKHSSVSILASSMDDVMGGGFTKTLRERYMGKEVGERGWGVGRKRVRRRTSSKKLLLLFPFSVFWRKNGICRR